MAEDQNTDVRTADHDVRKLSDDDIPQAGARRWKYNLPTERPYGKVKPREVQIAEPTEAIINQTFELAAPWEGRSDTLHMSVAQGIQLRFCLKNIGGKEVNYLDLEGSKLWDYIDMYEFSLLVRALDTLTSPRKTEVEDFLRTGELVSV